MADEAFKARYQANLRFKADPFRASQMVFVIIYYSLPMSTFGPLCGISQMPSALHSARLAERMPS